MPTILIKNGYFITMDADDSRFYGDIYIEGNLIVEIAPQIEKDADKIIDASNMLILPGFVQSHVHLCQSLLRGQADDQPLLDWLDTITSLEFRHTPETLYALSSNLPPANTSATANKQKSPTKRAPLRKR